MSQTETDMSVQADQGVTAADTPAADQGVTAATTPTADEGVKSFEDHVMGVMEKAEESPASKEPDPKAAEAAEEAPELAEKKAPSEESDEVSEEELNRLNAKTRHRINTLLEQRRSLQSETQTLKAEMESLKPAAENYKRIEDYLRQNDLSAQDAGQALQLAALMQTSPVKAFKAMQPIYARLAQAAGAVLPDDLAEDVRLGRVTPQRAYELASMRAAQTQSQRVETRLRDQQKQQEEQTRAEREAQAEREHRAKLARAGDTLAAERKSKDPDWNLKEQIVVDQLKLDILTNGMPKDEAELRQRFDAAVAEAEKRVNPFRQKPGAINRPPTSVSSPASQKPQPKSLDDAIIQAMGGL